MRGLRRPVFRHVLALIAIAAIAISAGAIGCVDGMTPDCSDAATGCGPDLDGSLDRMDGDAPSDAPGDAAADVQAEAGDANADADLDGGDGG